MKDPLVIEIVRPERTDAPPGYVPFAYLGHIDVPTGRILDYVSESGGEKPQWERAQRNVRRMRALFGQTVYGALLEKIKDLQVDFEAVNLTVFHEKLQDLRKLAEMHVEGTFTAEKQTDD